MRRGERTAVAAALKVSDAHFRAISDASPLGILVSDELGNCIYTNEAYQKISGLTFEQALGSNWSLAIQPEDRQRVLAEWSAAASGRTPFQSEVRFSRSDGSVVWARLNAVAMRIGKSAHGNVQTVEDITARKAVEAQLRLVEEALFAEKERAQVTLNSIGDAVLTTDLEGRLTYLNSAAEVMTGWTGEEAMGRPLPEVFNIIDGSTRQIAANPAQVAIAEDKVVGLAADCLLIRRDGGESAIEDSAAPIHNREGRVVGAVIVFHDVSVSRAMTAKMSHMAHHDFLTGLPNRALLTERLEQAIASANRRRKQTALLFIDLDYFKHINDSLGHSIGDQLLQAVAERLFTCIRATDTLSRQGGDEFVVLLADIEQPQDAANVAEKLITALVAPQQVGDHELHVTLSIGISIYPDDGKTAETLMKNADTAMYAAKASGRDNYQFFKAEMNAEAVRHLLIENNLRRALTREEFVLHYQSQIDLASGAMTGVEALVRWLDPDLGLLYPGQFIPIAIECGLIVPIGRWVLREACRQVKAWLDAGLPVVPVAVNVSAAEFRHKNFLAGVASILTETGLAPHYLELELTESSLLSDVEASLSMLHALKAMGLQLAIDNFGTGYSSLSYLRRFPIDTLKIDQSFVFDLATSDGGEGQAAFVGAVIGMGRNLKQRVIAEGVETLDQLTSLRARQCAEGQGFHFSRPLSAAEFASLLVAERPEVAYPSPG